jgi:CDP-paratose synthetase
MNKTVVIGGGTGFLGSYLVNHFYKLNYKVILLKRSFSNIWRLKNILSKITVYDIDKISLDHIFKTELIDYVIYAGTNYGRKGESHKEIIEANLTLPLVLVEHCIKARIKKFINTDTVLPKFSSTYSLSKKQFSEWLKFISGSKTSIINLEIEHFYGEKDDETKFIPSMIIQLLNNVSEIKLTKGQQLRDFIYVEDVVKAISLLILKEDLNSNEYYNFQIGSGKAYKIEDLVLLIKKLTNNNVTKLNFGALPYRENELMKSNSNISDIIKYGWKPETNLEKGLLKTINWFKNNKK